MDDNYTIGKKTPTDFPPDGGVTSPLCLQIAQYFNLSPLAHSFPLPVCQLLNMEITNCAPNSQYVYMHT